MYSKGLAMKFDDTDTAVVWINNNKENERQPDYTGKVNWGGEEKRLAGWVKKTEDGTPTMISFKISEPRQRKDTPSLRDIAEKTKKQDNLPDDEDVERVNLDDIPF